MSKCGIVDPRMPRLKIQRRTPKARTGRKLKTEMFIQQLQQLLR